MANLTYSLCIILESIDPIVGTVGCWRTCVKKLEVYEHLLQINSGFDQAIRSLAVLRKHKLFHRSALARVTALSKETRAVTNSYLVAIIETAETDEAGRRFRERKAQERAEEGN